MSDIVIDIQELGKAYAIYDSHGARLIDALLRERSRAREFWALQDVSFSVRGGEVVGIVGRNGSGKSTLLQMIAGTLTPSSGRAVVNGRVAALLELGSGFNPEYSGRENIFLNGLLLGATREEIAECLGEIESFADIGAYFDQPVKTYSSGMVVRLAFAVQALLPKDILIVDEALAVGDELFQRKCFAAMEQFREKGGTVLFVSHSGEAVVQLCDRALLLHHGKLVLDGSAKYVMDWYHKLIYASTEAAPRLLAQISAANGVTRDTVDLDVIDEPLLEADAITEMDYDPHLQSCSTMFYEMRGARFVDYAVRDAEGRRVNLLRSRQTYEWVYEVEFTKVLRHARFGMTIKTAAGLELGGMSSAPAFRGVGPMCAGQRLRVHFAFTCLLAPGIYFINAGVAGGHDGEEYYLARAVDLGVFRVLPTENGHMLSGGVVDFLIEPRINAVQ